MIFWILVVFQILAGIVVGGDSIKKTDEGRATLQTLSKAGYFFLRWRAFADYKRELFGVQRIFAILTVAFTAMFFVFGKRFENPTFGLLPVIFMVLWMAMKFGTDFRKSVRELLFMPVFMAIGPWVVYFVDNFTGFRLHLISMLFRTMGSLGVYELPELLMLVLLSVFGLVSGLFVAVFHILILSVVPLFFLFLIVGSSTVSRRALSVAPNAAYNTVLVYCYFVSPILIALESKGVF